MYVLYNSKFGGVVLNGMDHGRGWVEGVFECLSVVFEWVSV